jgi:hypothetical protein
MSEWIRWEPDKQPKPGTRIRLKFVNEVISNPITIVDGRGLAWNHHGYSWAKSDRLKRMNSLHISHYQIVEE